MKGILAISTYVSMLIYTFLTDYHAIKKKEKEPLIMNYYKDSDSSNNDYVNNTNKTP